jgi:hypothetical protein
MGSIFFGHPVFWYAFLYKLWTFPVFRRVTLYHLYHFPVFPWTKPRVKAVSCCRIYPFVVTSTAAMISKRDCPFHLSKSVEWQKFCDVMSVGDRLCGLVVRVSGYRYNGLGFDFRRYQIFWVAVGLGRGTLSLVSLVRSIEELLE